MIGVVVMAYGTPASLDDVEGYYTHIRRGRPPEPHLLEELIGRYQALGGTSPLRAITEAQAAAIGDALGDGFAVALGQKHAAPFIEDGARSLVEAGATSLVGVVLAPHFSKGSVGEYAKRLDAAAAELGVTATTVPQWHDLPEYRRFLANGIASGLMSLPARTKVLFTAHSLPERVLVDDPYPEQLRESAAAVAASVGLDRWTGWSVAWQSAGRTADPWRGPDVLEVLDDLAGTGRADGVLVCPQGFVADHLEVLYDL
ncbi:MAG: ferrochelatase, partial [Acidimicrobiia bacterium]|nr:ferrochelatase [Acidimicrobiia bacterium]